MDICIITDYCFIWSFVILITFSQIYIIKLIHNYCFNLFLPKKSVESVLIKENNPDEKTTNFQLLHMFVL
jgi:hypothetical protein